MILAIVESEYPPGTVKQENNHEEMNTFGSLSSEKFKLLESKVESSDKGVNRENVKSEYKTSTSVGTPDIESTTVKRNENTDVEEEEMEKIPEDEVIESIEKEENNSTKIDEPENIKNITEILNAEQVYHQSSPIVSEKNIKAEENEFTDTEKNKSGTNKDSHSGSMNGKEIETTGTEVSGITTTGNPRDIKSEETEGEEKVGGRISSLEQIDNDEKSKTPKKPEIEGIEEIEEFESEESSSPKINVKVKVVKIPANEKIDTLEIVEIENTTTSEGGNKETANEVAQGIHDQHTDLEEYIKIEANDAKPKCGLMTCPLEAKYCKVETKSEPPDFIQVLKSFKCLSETNEVLKAIETLAENLEPGRYFKNVTTQPIVVDNQTSINLGDFWGQ